MTSPELTCFLHAMRHQFWPPLLMQLRESCPLAYRVLAGCIVLSYQNAEVERDLGMLKKVRDRALGQLGDSAIDARARIRIEGPKVLKRPWCQTSGLHYQCCPWAGVKQKTAKNPSASRVGGLQGNMPQRARKRQAGPNRVVVEAQPAWEVLCDAESVLQNPEDMCSFLRATEWKILSFGQRGVSTRPCARMLMVTTCTRLVFTKKSVHHTVDFGYWTSPDNRVTPVVATWLCPIPQKFEICWKRLI